MKMMGKAAHAVAGLLVYAVAWPVWSAIGLVVVVSAVTGGLRHALGSIVLLGIVSVVLRWQFPSVMRAVFRFNSRTGAAVTHAWRRAVARWEARSIQRNESLLADLERDRHE